MNGAMISKKGGRESNEDYIGRIAVKGMHCYVLADGIGGQSGGETASEIAVNTILECFKAQPGMSKDLVYAYLEAAQNAIAEARRAAAGKRQMGTTVVMLITDGEYAVWAHCGDSRIYRLKKSRIYEVSEDHSVAFSSFLSGEIKYSEIRYSPDQNKLLRALGGESFRPDITDPVKLPKNSSFLLCSDGFWEYVNEDFMEKSRKKSQSPRQWLEAMLREYKRNAPSDADNYSAMIVFI